MSTTSADGTKGDMPTPIDTVNKVQLAKYQGMMVLQYLDPAEIRVQKIKEMEIRDSDVLLCSYPKSGTHWLFRILYMLVSGRAEYRKRTADLTFLDMQPIDRIKNVDSPRVLVTHYPFDLLPDQVKAGKAKVVHVYRNPKAVTVSFCIHLQNIGKIPNLSLPMLEGMLFSNEGPYRSMFYYFDKVKEFEENYPDVSIHHFSYEDMKKDTKHCIKKLAAHLQVEASDELCSQIAETVSFKKQKQEEEKQSDKAHDFHRKGEVSDWKNYLTVAQSERFDQVLSERADTCRFSARYRP